MASSNNNSVATKKDIEELKHELLGTLAAKEEIKKLATKEEIKKLATKAEIKRLATKEEIKKLATKEELSFEIGMLATSLDEMKADNQNTKDVLLQAIDGLAKRLDDSLTEQAAFNHTFDRHEAQLENHEQRITVLEQQKP